MLQIPVSKVISKIKEETELSEKEIKSKINSKIENLDGLVSEEGAAYIVASELGVSLLDSAKKSRIKVENVSGGMRSVDIVGKVTRVFQPSHWEKGDKKGKVASFILADQTGTIRIVIWDNRVDWIAKGKIKPGSTIRVKNGYAKKSKRGQREIHLNKSSQLIIDPEGVEVDVDVDKFKKKRKEAKEADIKDVEEGNRVKIRGTIVQLFAPYFYLVCPKCRKKLNDDKKCEEHGEVEPTNSVVFNFVLDDGTGTLRSVAFGQSAKILMGLEEDLDKLADEKSENLKEKLNNSLLGKVIIAQGIVRKSRSYDRLELIVNRSKVNIDPKKLARSLHGK